MSPEIPDSTDKLVDSLTGETVTDRSHKPCLVASSRAGRPSSQPLLDDMLAMLVPLRMSELRPHTDDELVAMVHADDLAGILGSHGDAIQFGGRHFKGTLNALVTGLAVAALIAPGGVTAFGGHWCAQPPCAACPPA